MGSNPVLRPPKMSDIHLGKHKPFPEWVYETLKDEVEHIEKQIEKMTETEQQQSSVTEEEQETSKYDPGTDGDLFLYQISLALDGDKEVIPKINFRRKHPQLGSKISNHEIRIRKMEGSIRGLKVFLKEQIQHGMHMAFHEMFDKVKDQLVEDL